MKRIAIIGAGQMGVGIAQVAAGRSYEISLLDASKEQAEKGKSFIAKQLQRQLEKAKISKEEMDTILGRISCSHSYEDLVEADFAIEAVTENLDLKSKIFQELDKHIKKEAILASNTSSISITKLAAQTNRPEKVVGMHFMNPVPIMELVEGIRGIQTSPETFSSMRKLAEDLGKTVVEAKDFSGFLVNRVLLPMINEAIYALHESVATAEDIDLAMQLGCRHPMGPLRLADFIGLDTCLSIMEVLHNGLGDSKYRPCPLLKQYVDANYLGKKVSIGFYDYRGEKIRPTKKEF